MEKKKHLYNKPLNRLINHLTQGNLWLYVLALAQKKEIYIYKLDEEIEKKFRFKPSKIMLYLVVYRLESFNMLKSHYSERRKYYQITEYGKETLNNAIKEMKKIASKLEK
ncbi:MAG: PadR family transcriptional regulator [Candidatus Micrarchaeota archaeon]|nr:PadR family transcriptional regulator [Candidatus Micrarchaeota archaeon]